ncbi:MAG: right-handed parallel beta-helix repeat-containing protein [Candidatus Heimdallarchaeum endolithica]|uniref:Right-handed parallel beta-helix repeat-containing protein n=1 Tax=Candidatus Heimdallarchaeum endolithica TaxID=2876572 RepID=A0A9Y1BTQ6_9ARCH|nr:MAG: right-handed parallel beta-helix repeat-containing protein [Candidatus Heimdallarchaeum endolithica]
MKKKLFWLQRTFLTFAVTIIFTLSLNTSQFTPGVFAIENDINYFEISSQQPISIENDEDFKKYDFSGNGSSSNPYLIKNLVIIGKTIAISVKNTTKYFAIVDCRIRFCDIGIYIFNASKGTAVILNNSLSYIQDQNALGSVGQAIFVSESEGIKIENNEIIDSDIAIFLSQSPYSQIVNNIIKEKYGITVISSIQTLIENNSLTNCGLNIYGKTEIEEYNAYIIKNNFINDKKLGYFVDLTDKVIDKGIYGQILLINCTNFAIENQVLTDTTTGITMYFCKNIEITNCYSYSNIFEGVAAYGSSDIYIHNSILEENGFGFTGCGIRLRETEDSLIEDNVMRYNKGDGGILASLTNNISIKNNVLSFNKGEGIALKTCNNTKIQGNICFGNGIDGLSLLATNNSLIEKNYFVENAETGVFLFDSCYNSIINNTIMNNYNYGIMLMDAIADNKVRCRDNIIYLNFFINNNVNGTSQAFDNGYNNKWYNETIKKGNYWSDNTKRKYEISGAAKSYDKFPIKTNLERVSFSNFIYLSIIICVVAKIKKNKELKKFHRIFFHWFK